MGAIQVRPPESTCNGPILCDFKLGREYVTKGLSRSRSRPPVLPIQMFPSDLRRAQLPVQWDSVKETPFALYRNSPRLVATQMFESRSRSILETWTLPRDDGNSARRKPLSFP